MYRRKKTRIFRRFRRMKIAFLSAIFKVTPPNLHKLLDSMWQLDDPICVEIHIFCSFRQLASSCSNLVRNLRPLDDFKNLRKRSTYGTSLKVRYCTGTMYRAVFEPIAWKVDACLWRWISANQRPAVFFVSRANMRMSSPVRARFVRVQDVVWNGK